MIEYAKTIGSILTVYFAIISIIDRRLISTCRKENAITAESAITLFPTNPFIRWRLARLQKKGWLCLVGLGTYYLNLPLYLQWRQHRLKRLKIFFSALLFIGIVVVLMHLWGALF